MGVTFSTLFNDTIEDASFTLASLDTLSFRYERLQPGTYIEVNGISWGFTATLGATTANLQGRLFIIRNEVFDPVFNYGNSVFANFKDIVMKDIVSRFNKVRNLDFAIPLKLDQASSFLIVAGGFTDPDNIGTTVNAYLSVRAKLIDPQSQQYTLKPR